MAYYRDPTLQVNLGKRVRELRLAKNLTQEDVAYSSEMDISQINRIELGKINGSLAVISRIAKALDVEIKELFDFKS